MRGTAPETPDTVPGGAAALATALYRTDEIEGDDVIVTISGGNVDPAMFTRALEQL